MALAAGDKLGPYEILGLLGKGGMGEVYRAHDQRLGRDVAIKVSQGKFSERFEREARAVAALNHQHICALYDVGQDYLVMEYVEGAPLKGPMPLGHVVKYASQICDALDAAHKKGITHRDLKPANVLVNKTGAKLLDFGLARVAASGDDTVTIGVAGTPGYMSPEQWQGKPGDPRSDIYALGCLLFEMLTGKRLTPQERPHLEPPFIEHIVKGCLQENPEDRWQSVRDIKFELEWGATDQAAGGRSTRISYLGPAITGILTLALAALAFVHFREAAPQQPTIHSTILPPDKTSFAFSTNLGPMSLSPDGKRMAFAATGQDGKSPLWIRSLDSGTAQRLQGTDGGTFPFWSPDGLWVAFFADGKLKKIDTRGGSPVALAEASNGYGGSWSAKGVIVFAPTIFAPLLKIGKDGGKSSPAADYSGGNGFPWFLPDGEHFLFGAWGGSGHMSIRLGSLSSTDSTIVGEADSNAIYAGGRLLYLSGTSLMAQPFNLNSFRSDGAAEPIAEGVQRFLDLVSVGAFSASSSGSLAYQTGSSDGRRQLSWFDRAGNPIKTLGDPRAFFSIELSPDGRTLAASAPDALGNYDLWLFDVPQGLATRFTSDPGGEYYGVWSPDGRTIILNSTRKGHYDLFQKPAKSSGSEELLYADHKGNEGFVPTSWSPDGKFLLYFTGGGLRHEIWLLPLTPDRPGAHLKPVRFLNTGFNELFGQFSPDGQWVAYGSDESGRSQIYVTPFSRPGERRQISANGGTRPRWRRDGKELYYIALDGKLIAAELRVGAENVEVVKVHALLTITSSDPSSTAGYPYEISPDGQRILTAIAPVDGAIQPVTLVQNWTGALKK